MAAEKFLIFITCECKIELGKFRPFRTRGTLPYIFEISLEFKSLLKKGGLQKSYHENYCEVPFQTTQISQGTRNILPKKT